MASEITKTSQVWYSTRYCLTTGIVEVTNGEVCSTGEYVSHGEYGFDKIGKDIFPTRAEALADRKNRALKAIEAAKRKIAKMEKLVAQPDL